MPPRDRLSPVLIIACHLLGNIAAYSSCASFNLRPRIESRIWLISLLYYAGVAFGLVIIPVLANSVRKNSGRAWKQRICLVVLFLLAFALLLTGYDAWLRDGWLRHATNFFCGILLPASYFVLFAGMPFKRSGLWFGAGISAGIFAWQALILYCTTLRDAPGADPMAGMDMVFMVHSGSLGLLVILLVYIFLCKTAVVLAWAGPFATKPVIPPTRRNLAFIFAACILLYILNALIDIRLFSAIKIDKEDALSILHLVVIITSPLPGWLVSQKPASTPYWVMRICSWIFIVSPCLLILGGNPGLYKLVHTLATIGQFACTIVFSVILAGMAANAATATSWAALIFLLKIISIFCYGFFHYVLQFSPSSTMLVGTLVAFLFYHCIKQIQWTAFSPVVRATPGTEVMGRMETAAEMDTEARIADFLDTAELSQREREVADLVLRGASSREIAAALGITEHTVKAHVRNMLNKYGLPNRRAMMAACFVTTASHDHEKAGNDG